MVSTIASRSTQTLRTRAATSAPARSPHRVCAAPTLEEAYEPIGTIKSRVHLALGHLRARLEQRDR
jgi:hypothetical protein